MKRKIQLVLLLTITLFSIQPLFAMQKIYYTLRGDNLSGIKNNGALIKTIATHHREINMIISQAYQLDGHGTLWGMVNKHLLRTLKKYHIAFMPMVTNTQFNTKKTHLFLANSKANHRAIKNILVLCKRNGFRGVQIDFEHVNIRDREAYSSFYQQLAKTLHSNGYKISIAIFPRTHDMPPTTILKNLYNGWAAAYDYKLIAKNSDFVTIMAYGQHAGATTPGPNAGIPWVKSIIKYTLRYMPANKISLGIPSYSLYWRMHLIHGRAKSNAVSLNHQTVMKLLKRYHATLRWEPTEKVAYTFFNVDQFNQYIFAENARTFAERLKLIKTFHLRGFSLWRLGLEDANIWNVLKKHARHKNNPNKNKLSSLPAIRSQL